MGNIGIGKAIGKIILMGEHSVVYGEPAIAMPFPSAKIESKVTEGRGQVHLDCFSYNGPLENIPEGFLGLRKVIQKTVEELGEPLEKFNIEIQSTIPPQRGMGSSAAVSAATVRALYKFFNRDLNKDRLTELVNFSETIVHGNPSGIDTAIVVGQEPLYYIKGEPLKIFNFKIDAYLVVADTGQEGETKFAVSKVKEYIDNNGKKGKEVIEALGTLVRDSKKSIKNNKIDELGDFMNQAQELLSRLGVSNSKINNLVSVSRRNGALGAKLTGGGLGGAVISLCKHKKDAEIVSKLLKENGAKNTWTYFMGVGKDES